MTVVSNTSPINYLLLIGEERILPRLFDRVRIPRTVELELGARGSPALVRKWIQNPPEWLGAASDATDPLELTPDLKGLDDGEVQAITLALRTSAMLLLMDDRSGREVAEAVGLKVVGTLGLLDRADELGGLADLPDALERLSSSGFFAAKSLHDHVLRRHLLRVERKRESTL